MCVCYQQHPAICDLTTNQRSLPPKSGGKKLAPVCLVLGVRHVAGAIISPASICSASRSCLGLKVSLAQQGQAGGSMAASTSSAGDADADADVWECWWCYDGWHPAADRLERRLPRWARLHRMDPSRPLAEQVRHARVLIPTTGSVSADAIDAPVDLRLIAQPAAGYNNIDVEAARRRGVPVTIAPGARVGGGAFMRGVNVLSLSPQGPTERMHSGWRACAHGHQQRAATAMQCCYRACSAAQHNPCIPGGEQDNVTPRPHPIRVHNPRLHALVRPQCRTAMHAACTCASAHAHTANPHATHVSPTHTCTMSHKPADTLASARHLLAGI